MKTKILLSLVAPVFFWHLTAPAQSWTPTSAPTTNWWSIASSADGSKLAAVTAYGTACEIHLSTNAGLTWVSNYFLPVGDGCVASSADGNVLGVLGAGGVPGTNGLCISTNAGMSWTCPKLTNAWWSSIASSADGSKLVALGESPEEIVTSTNFGATWTVQTGAPALTGQSHWGAVASSADGAKLVACVWNGGWIYTSTNGGTSWVPRIHDRSWVCVASSADGATLAAGSAFGFLYNTYTNYPSIYVSTDCGATWLTNVFPACDMIGSLACSADGTTMLATVRSAGSAALLQSTDSGRTWSPANAPANNWRGVCASADGGKLAAVVAGGGIWLAQSIPAPRMQVTRGTTSLTLTWPIPSTNFILQQNSDLTTASWSNVTNAPVFNLTNLQNQITLPLPVGNQFYRLRTP